MKYSIEFTKTALKQLRKLPKKAQKRIGAAVELLSENPRPPKHEPLKGSLKGLCRVRTGGYRIVYQIHDKKLVVCVVGIGDRKEVYKQL